MPPARPLSGAQVFNPAALTPTPCQLERPAPLGPRRLHAPFPQTAQRHLLRSSCVVDAATEAHPSFNLLVQVLQVSTDGLMRHPEHIPVFLLSCHVRQHLCAPNPHKSPQPNGLR